MDAPPVQYVRTTDGYDIAYTTAGEGLPFIYFPNHFSHAQMFWSASPLIRPWLEGLAARFRTVVFDGRGQGMSTRGLREPQTVETLTHDLDVVIARLSLDRFILMAQVHSTHLAVRYALEHPDRVAALILIGCSLKLDAWPVSMFHDLPGENWRAFLVSQTSPSRGFTPEQAREVLGRLEQTVTSDDFVGRMQAFAGSDLTESVARLRIPTLVLHPRELIMLPAEESMKLAARIPGAQFAFIEGDGPPADAASGLAAIDTFVAGLNLTKSTAELPARLSSREVEVIRLIAAGRSNQQIAGELVISLNTVRRHVSNILTKTGAANRTEASAYAHRAGLA